MKIEKEQPDKQGTRIITVVTNTNNIAAVVTRHRLSTKLTLHLALIRGAAEGEVEQGDKTNKYHCALPLSKTSPSQETSDPAALTSESSNPLYTTFSSTAAGTILDSRQSQKTFLSELVPPRSELLPPNPPHNEQKARQVGKK